MGLAIQDPAAEDGNYLIEDLLGACGDATEGGGAFAFASPAGIALLTDDHVFRAFIDRGTFRLIIGLGAITNVRALELLTRFAERHPTFHASAFLSPSTLSLFHPKFAWFGGRATGTLIVGSGNLTTGGLRSNWEAYSIQTLDRPAIENVSQQWTRWLQREERHLVALTSQEAVERARFNEIAPRIVPPRPRPAPEPGTTGLVDPEGSVLIAEIPAGGARWHQANFSLHVFQSYFGATVGASHRIHLTHISEDGTVGPVEVRPSVAVRSHNYRFELDAGSGIAYPSVGRPVAIFLKIAKRTFLYTLLMPGSDVHAAFERYFDIEFRRRPGRVSRIITDPAQLRNLWPGCPLIGAGLPTGDE